MTSAITFLVLVAFAMVVHANAAADKITHLPGIDNSLIKFNQYSGYLDIPGTQKHYHYWFVESMGNPAQDPVVLWLNGGPGCSSLLGFMTEQGPFRPNASDPTTLVLNPYAWNKVANVIFLESPAGVGFSYSDNPSKEYETGDNVTASDNYAALQQWFARFPEYNSSDFYITGESFAGHYLPELSHNIIMGWQGPNPITNFKGFLGGNLYTDWFSNTIATYQQQYSHSLISTRTYEGLMTYCVTDNMIEAQFTKECMEYTEQANIATAFINPYSIYTPICHAGINGQSPSGIHAQRQRFKEYTSNGLYQAADTPGMDIDPAYDPCAEDHAATYLNLASVQTAIHVKAMKWHECSNKILYNPLDNYMSMEKYYPLLFQNNLHITIYNGDVDTVCPHQASRYIVEEIFNQTLVHDWTPWFTNDNKEGKQTAGWYEIYEDISYVTVRNAGHEVPQYQPERALDLLKNYLNGVY